MDFQDGRTLGFGWVRGEHRLDVDTVQTLRDLFVIQTGVLKRIQSPTP